MSTTPSAPRGPDPSALLGRRQALRLLGLIGVGAALPTVAGSAPSLAPGPVVPEPVRTSPVFFPEADYRLLCRLVDLIIPPTDTAGAVQAGVPPFIDAALASGNGAQLGEMSGSSDVFADNAPVLFADGLRWIQDQARSKHGRGFLELEEARQAALLETLFTEAEADPNSPGRAHHFLRALKDLTATAYYTSEPGLMRELGYKGNTPRMAFKAECDPRIPQGAAEGP